MKVHLSKDLKKRESSHADNREESVPGRGDKSEDQRPSVWLEWEVPGGAKADADRVEGDPDALPCCVPSVIASLVPGILHALPISCFTLLLYSYMIHLDPHFTGK